MRNQRCIGEGIKLNQSDTVRMLSQQLDGHLQGQSRLTDSAGAVQREQAGRSEEPFDLLDLALPSNEARQGRGEIVPRPGSTARGAGEVRRPSRDPTSRRSESSCDRDLARRDICAPLVSTIRPTVGRVVRLRPGGQGVDCPA